MSNEESVRCLLGHLSKKESLTPENARDVMVDFVQTLIDDKKIGLSDVAGYLDDLYSDHMLDDYDIIGEDNLV